MSDLDTAALRAFMAYLRTDYVSTRPIAVPKQLAPKTLRNYWITLRSFVTWAMAECGIADILKPLNPPEFEPPEIDPLTEAEVQALLQATSHTRRAKPDGKVAYTMRQPTARRDRAWPVVDVQHGSIEFGGARRVTRVRGAADGVTTEAIVTMNLAASYVSKSSTIARNSSSADSRSSTISAASTSGSGRLAVSSSDSSRSQKMSRLTLSRASSSS